MSRRFIFIPAIVRSLMEIETARETVRLTVLPPQVVERLRQEARVRSTHYSTRIEGNRLTLVEAEQAVLAGRRFPGLERDVREVQNSYRALQRVEEWAEQQIPVTEDLILTRICRPDAPAFRRGEEGRPAFPHPRRVLKNWTETGGRMYNRPIF